MDTLVEDDRNEVASEVAATESDRRLAAAIRAGMFPGLAGPGSGPTSFESDSDASLESSELQTARLGRYAILRELGRGGMGVVFACYDEQLDRKVAVKLLRSRSRGEAARLRLEREALALARLSHPNVVQIYELGDHRGATFVAMEYVVGETLRAWLRAEPRRDWRATLAILRACGAGLAAAHAQGLVHRDFKPDNVMVGTDGRARVLDFGIVRLGGERESQDDSDLAGSSTELTRTGAVIGTPAYMSPEQLDALPCDAASDQFSFCVVAFEALYGTRPFLGADLAALAESLRVGEPVAIPSDSPVPKSLRAAILRGLSPQPGDRWPSMDALLDEFDRALAGDRKPQRAAWALAGVAGVAVVMLAIALAERETLRPCEFDETALRGTWDAADRRALRTELGDASQAERIDERLSAWTSAWLDGQTRVCEATRVQAGQSESLLDLRMGCLETRRRETDAIVELLLDPATPNTTRAFELLEQLPDLEACHDPHLAETSHPLPADSQRREAILIASGEVQRARSLADVGRLAEADALVEALAERSATLDHLPLTIEIEALGGERLLWRGRVAQAIPRLRTAIGAAEVARLDELAATLRVEVAREAVGQWARPELQAMLLDEAEIALARLARPDDRRHVELALARARWHDKTGDYAAAEAGYRDSLEAARAHAELVSVGRAQRSLAHLQARQGRYEEAEAGLLAAQATFEAARGPSPLLDADLELHLGLLALDRGDLDAATTRFVRARTLLGELLDPADDTLGLLELAEAKLAFLRGDLDGAGRGFARVIELGVNDLRVAEAWEAIGVIRYYESDFAGSLDGYRRALHLRLATQGPEHPDVGVLHSNIGESLAASGDHGGALASFAEALAVLQRALPPEHPDFALPYKGRAKSRLALGEREGAILDLEHALLLHAANPGEVLERADVEFTLARALHDAGERGRALELAEQARTRVTTLGHAEQATAISTWILEHP